MLWILIALICIVALAFAIVRVLILLVLLPFQLIALAISLISALAQRCERGDGGALAPISSGPAPSSGSDAPATVVPFRRPAR